ncbi:MAG: 3-phosphoshikimate 1-carboxyvinyltransferase [Coprococcus sp.]
METYAVKPIFYHRTKPFNLTIEAPGSKSITNRALMLAALSDGETLLNGALFSDDSRHFLQCLVDLGFDVHMNEEEHSVRVMGLGGSIPKKTASINVGSAGTAARFLTAMLGCAKGTYHLDASEQMKKRPMAPLLKTLTELGCIITYDEKPGFFPFTIQSQGITATEATIDIGDSSQFLSALLMSSVMIDHDFTIHITGTHGLSYIAMTMQMMLQFNAVVQSPEVGTYHIPGNSRYQACTYQIEPDVSAAAYFYGMAALSGGSVLVHHVHFDSLQGDVALLHAFECMGCQAADTQEGVLLTGPSDGHLKGIDINMGSFSDQALTLAAIAPFADGPTRIRNVGHIRLQESDRMASIIHNLTLMGIHAEIQDNDILIEPGAPHPALIETYEDHRVAMAFSLTGLRTPGIVISNPLCCRKTFENYFEVLDGICADNIECSE